MGSSFYLMRSFTVQTPAPALPPPNLMVHPTAQPLTGAPVERGPAAKVFFDKGEPHSRLQNVKFSCIEPMVPDGPCVPGPGCHPPSLPPSSCLTPDASVVLRARSRRKWKGVTEVELPENPDPFSGARGQAPELPLRLFLRLLPKGSGP